MNRRSSLRLAFLFVLSGMVSTSGCASAQEPWPNLNDAERNLQAALDDLDRAPDRFAGHKAEAQRLIRAAIAEIEQAKRSFR